MPHLTKLFLGLTCIRDSWFEDVTFHCNPLEVLDLGTWIDSKSFQAIQNNISHVKELYLCVSDVEDNDFLFSSRLFPRLEKICLVACWGLTIWSLVALIQSCPFLKHIYVDKEVALSCVDHPFFRKNKHKLGLIKFCGCYQHRKVDYLCT